MVTSAVDMIEVSTMLKSNPRHRLAITVNNEESFTDNWSLNTIFLP